MMFFYLYIFLYVDWKKNLHISGPTVQICVVQGPTVLWKHMCRVWDKSELSLWVSIHKPVRQNKLWGTLCEMNIFPPLEFLVVHV